ncbi:MAG: polymer-forming cytoskeletal protein [Myxococcota bacterium]
MDNRTGGWRRLVHGAPEQKAAPESEPAVRVSEPGVTVIEPGVEMNGRLVVPHSLRIEGEFGGEIECAAAVFVSETGAVEAPIRARTVEIRGAVVGNIVASREVVIHATGRLHGDVETPSLVVVRGATFNGGTRMYRPERSAHTSALPDRHADVSLHESQA